MPSIKDLRKRIGTVKNTQQTTKAMKMVSAAKLRRSQEAITAQRPYAKKVSELIRLVSSMTEEGVDSPLLQVSQNLKPEAKHCLFVIVSSDRGLCGGFNGNISKTASRWLEENQTHYGKITTLFVGKKAFDYFSRRGRADSKLREFGRSVKFEAAAEFTKSILDMYLRGEFTEIKILYNEFKNAITQKPTVESFVPVHEESLGISRKKNPEMLQADLYIVKPDHKTILDLLLRKHFAIQMFRIFLESQASEHGARMSAMDSATRNAGEMIKKLSLQYNKQRQAGITKELLEIISGAESQKGSA